MSEYHYYEFVAIDQALSKTAQNELRGLSSRAEITATRFANTYHYGDFRGDPAKVLARYFDAAVYVSSLGMRRVAFRLPRESVDAKAVRPYLCDNILTLTTTREHAVLTFEWNDEEGGDWVVEEEAEGWLTALLPLRAQLLRGDLAPLYIPWLHHAWTEHGYDSETAALKEPPVPTGLRAPNAALRTVVEFFAINEDLFAAAAESSADDVGAEPDPDALKVWIAKRTVVEKNELLSRVAAGEGARVAAELLRAFADQQRAAAGAPTVSPRRRFAEIAARADILAEKRKRKKDATAARARVAREKADAIARKKRLDALARRVPAAWTDVDRHIALQNAPGYDEALALLLDLRALAEREGAVASFSSKLRGLRDRHPGKPALHRRLRVFKVD